MRLRLMRATFACLAAIAAVTASTAAAQAAGPSVAPLSPGHGRVISGQFIVVLQDGADAAAVARRTGVTTQRTYSAAIDGFAARLSASQLAAVRRDRAVKFVEPDSVVTTLDKPTPSAPTSPPKAGARFSTDGGVSAGSVQTGATWGLDRIDQRTRTLNGLYYYTSTGAGVTAYVIDTGILTTHTQFGGRAVGGFTAIADGRGATDCHGHGTHVAGTIGGSTWGVAKSVRLVAVRVLGCTGSGTTSGVISGVDYVTFTHAGPSVANMSLGGGFSAALNAAVANSSASGVSYAVAAGNENQNACNVSPASTGVVMTVGATDRTDTRASFSNWGSCVDIFDPGVGITSAWITSTTATAVLSGTSMATPHVAGLMAQFLQISPFATQATVNSVLTNTAVAGVVTNPSGSPNLLGRRWNGTISGTGASSYQPDGSYWYQANSGWIRAWLQGTGATDPDLYLRKWNGSAWVSVAGSASVTPQERIAYLGGPGYYTLQAYGFNGAGTYDAWATKPA